VSDPKSVQSVPPAVAARGNRKTSQPKPVSFFLG
jgi:hypothetical protein